ncbi:SDR family NAD(P)-dependent oxidoreductase [Saccharothrix yanglingensis]|uniref:Short-chain dehydrogenase n=1 Tax=Saccharothrix yanglingensis TaxID=659496 RepID=A0ABU0XC53_9PSEU|nr:SDR family oxidoreductase [Saccharothrix yanglingensis]MDQ2589187.1 short-chain dehydrogenase [Saccharothrix yanglingensis]
MELRNQVALVTGATAGIGHETAKLFAREGASVIVHGRDAARGADVVAGIEADGGTARFVRADLSTAEGVRELASAAGEVDVLVNNAGIYPFASTADQTREGFEELLAVNVLAPFHLTAALAPAMVAKGAGAIVNVSTVAAVSPVHNAAAYGATKAALESLTRNWAVEFGMSGVRVNSVAPGGVTTGTVMNLFGDAVHDNAAATTALRRMSEPREIAEVILFLASPRSSYVTGALLLADGGYTIA